MNWTTKRYLYHVFQTQQDHAKNNPTDKLQAAYVEGIKTALEIIATEAFTIDRSIESYLDNMEDA